MNRNLSVSGRNLSVLTAEMSALLLILVLALIGSAVCPSPVQAWGAPVGTVEAAAAGSSFTMLTTAGHIGIKPEAGGVDPGPVTDRHPGQGLWLLAAAALLMLVFSIDNRTSFSTKGANNHGKNRNRFRQGRGR